MAFTTHPIYVVLRPEQHAVLGESEFGMAGLTAIESIGPFTGIRESGPLITVHDSTIDAHMGIGHHPHRFNERLFYIEHGELDHDDALNKITGHMDAGDVGEFTEGRRGMIHSEWNNGDIDTLAYILVYRTDPVPERTSFSALRDADAPRYDEGAGVHTKELVGPASPLQVHGDIRYFADSQLAEDAAVSLAFDDGEGGLASVREGAVHVDDDPAELTAGTTILVRPAAGERRLEMRSSRPSRVVRVVHGPGS
ncbi:MAG: pirin family protein [Actinomycetota bacterium]